MALTTICLCYLGPAGCREALHGRPWHPLGLLTLARLGLVLAVDVAWLAVMALGRASLAGPGAAWELPGIWEVCRDPKQTGR